ncbi:hypothetical protein D3C81_1988690 [compost metagenome]
MQVFHSDGLPSTACRVERIPAAPDDVAIIYVMGVAGAPVDELFATLTCSGVMARHHQVEPFIVLTEVTWVEMFQGGGQHFRRDVTP